VILSNTYSFPLSHVIIAPAKLSISQHSRSIVRFVNRRFRIAFLPGFEKLGYPAMRMKITNEHILMAALIEHRLIQDISEKPSLQNTLVTSDLHLMQ
jgi:hypothetical protein